MGQEQLALQQRLNRRQLFTFGAASLTALGLAGMRWQTGQAATLSTLWNGVSEQTGPNLATLQPIQAAVTLTGITHTWQTLNNCGPAVLAMALSYYGVTQDQQTIAQTLRPNPNDQNVRPDELATYALNQGFGATLRVNGDAERLRRFLSHGIPVILETWEGEDPMNLTDGFAHFRLVTGYDDARQVWIVYDSYFVRDPVNGQGPAQGTYVPYAQADRLWRIMNRKYVVLYPTVQASLVQQILAEDLDDQTMWQGALAQAQAELDQQVTDPFAWFNLGSSRYAAGLASEAVIAFHQAQALGLPQRMFWYQYELLEAYYATGQYAALVELVAAQLTTATGIEEFYYWQAMALAALGNTRQAQHALSQALTINPNYGQALAAVATVVNT
jgi:hypothetical protein